MGHCDSPAQLSRDSEFFGVNQRAIAVDSSRSGSRHGACQTNSVRERIVPGVRSLGAWSLLAFLRLYQLFLSPFLGGACKFYPSCSNYAYEAVTLHGARRGLVLAIKRLGRCRPFTKGGFDPVPEGDDAPGALLPQSFIAKTSLSAAQHCKEPVQ
jgi:uncharacterized protein